MAPMLNNDKTKIDLNRLIIFEKLRVDGGREESFLYKFSIIVADFL